MCIRDRYATDHSLNKSVLVLQDVVKQIPIRYCRMWHHIFLFPVSWSHPCCAIRTCQPKYATDHSQINISLCSTVLHSTALCFTVQHCALQYSTVLHNTALCFTIQHCASQYSIVLHNTALCFTVQHCASQYSTVLYSTALCFTDNSVLHLIFRQVWAHPCLLFFVAFM